jgi:hypothetical protein
MKEPKREDYPKGKKGDDAYNKARAEYVKWLQSETNRQTQMDLPSIQLPGLSRSPSDVEAKRWFKFVGARAKKGTQARKYYDDFVSALQNAGVPKKDWQSVWDDAIDWTQTYGSGSDGKPIKFLIGWNPSDYKDDGDTGPKYGTTKSKQTTVTEYSTSAAASDLTTAYKSELGREAGAADIAAYQAAVNKQAKGEPAVYTSTTTTAPGGKGVISTSKSTAVSQTGFDPTRFAIEYARSNPEYAENFAVRNFMKLIDQSLSDPNRIGQVVE